ncbi:hypothetical protein HCN44_001657 [Aphidius gifuensis]|uniref:Double-strand-break repair protein rad21 n=1 Tax=Aphidius gifuensis TaxID=684658 RepID=A0A834XVE6_APHGI|nr:double-strand-break repair protein rad21 homolog [Aphidius gifuensis]KAF7992332.1 hypothetical protein HCN44_001657 [Aphidius gifuensis]
MFYAHFVLAKKGPLARIWLAAHWDKKLTKAHVFETNIEKSVDGILQPKVKMALRTSGHLLLGVVRIYSRKAKYLLADCNEAFVKIKMAFRPGMVDLPEEHREAAVNAITLPEVFHDFDTAMPELKDVDIEAQFSLNQSRAEEITMREDYGNLSLVTHDQGFGDMSFDAEAPELLRHQNITMETPMDQSHLLFSDGPSIEPSLEIKDKEPIPGTSSTVQPMDIDTPIRDDGFGGSLGQDMISGGLFEGGLFDEAPMPETSNTDIDHITEQQDNNKIIAPGEQSVRDDSDDEIGDHFGGMPVGSPMGGMSSDGSRPNTPVTNVNDDAIGGGGAGGSGSGGIGGRISVASHRFTPAPQVSEELNQLDNPEEAPVNQDHTTLVHDEEESFALAPVDASALKGFTKAKRKRKLIVDEVKNISGEEMKAQLSDTSDIITTLDLAPPTKRLMHWKETGGVEKLFALPGRPIPSRNLFKNYQRHLTSRSYDHEEFDRVRIEDDAMPLEQMREVPEAEPLELQNLDQSGITTKRQNRKRKTPIDDDLVNTTAPKQLMEHPTNFDIPIVPPQPSPTHDIESVSQIEPAVPEVSSIQDESSIINNETNQIDNIRASESQINNTFDNPDNALSCVADENVQPSITHDHQQQQQEEELQQQQHQQPPPTPTPQQHINSEIPEMPEMDNMGYDHTSNQQSFPGIDDQQQPVHTPGGISERGPATPWNPDDYEFPHSAGPTDEQQVDETYEQFEERVVNKRAANMYTAIKSKLDIKDRLTLSEIASKNLRKQAAQKFYTLLVLKKFQVVELNQEYSYAEILVTKGPKWDNPSL